MMLYYLVMGSTERPETKEMNMTLEQVLAEMAKGSTSIARAKELMGENLTAEAETEIRKAQDQIMRGVFNHQATMRRVMARGF